MSNYSRGPFLAAMFLLVFWILFWGHDEAGLLHSRRSKAYRGLPEARMAGATVEETAFEDVNMWQAPVSQKPPLMRTSNSRMWQGQVWEARPMGSQRIASFFRPTPSWLSPGRYTRSTAAKKMNCKLACKAVNSSIASKALVMDQYKVQ